jgi:hypothetical protein
MPTINLRDGRNRDARVRAESVGERATVRYVDGTGQTPTLRKVLRATAEHAHAKLLAAVGGDEAALAAALVAGDPDVDVERIGSFLTGTSRVIVDAAGEIVYHVTETEVVRAPDGTVKERRPRKRPEPNTDTELPVTWTGRLVKKADALRRFVFSGKLQIVHVNGLTYDFLYAMAKELHEANALMLLGAGPGGKDPLVFTRHATPHRGFLEGRIQGDTYVLLLHLSKMELKRPAPVVADAPTAAVPGSAATVVAQVAPAVSPPPAGSPPESSPSSPVVSSPVVSSPVAATPIAAEPPVPPAAAAAATPADARLNAPSPTDAPVAATARGPARAQQPTAAPRSSRARKPGAAVDGVTDGAPPSRPPGRQPPAPSKQPAPSKRSARAKPPAAAPPAVGPKRRATPAATAGVDPIAAGPTAGPSAEARPSRVAPSPAKAAAPRDATAGPTASDAALSRAAPSKPRRGASAAPSTKASHPATSPPATDPPASSSRPKRQRPT